jgi:hypothetical protein
MEMPFRTPASSPGSVSGSIERAPQLLTRVLVAKVRERSQRCVRHERKDREDGADHNDGSEQHGVPP